MGASSDGPVGQDMPHAGNDDADMPDWDDDDLVSMQAEPMVLAITLKTAAYEPQHSINAVQSLGLSSSQSAFDKYSIHSGSLHSCLRSCFT